MAGLVLDTPAKHIYTGDGTTRVYPIPTYIQGDDWIRIEIDGVYIVDRRSYDIVNNSIIFVTAPGLNTQVSVQVATSVEALSQLGNSTNVDTVAGSIGNVNTVATDINNIDTVAGSIGNVNTVATDISNVDTVAGSIGNVNTVANNITNVNTTATNINNVNTVGTDINNVNTVANNINSVKTTATNINNVNITASSITNVNTVASNISNVNTVATNIVGINQIVNNLPEILLADDNATTATQQAIIATTKASEASASAVSASTSASTAITKANEASTSATNATNSATTATQQATIATTKASEASASANQALTSRNQAETFAQQAQASASSVDANNIVHRTGNETIDGILTFVKSPIVPTPINDGDAVNKEYVDTNSATLPIGAILNGYTIFDNCVVAFGGEFNRADYPKLWAYLQANPSLVKTQTQWQTEATANGGICGFFSSGDGTTTFRVPNLNKAFLRPDSRGVGSYQNHAFQNHIHGLALTGAIVASSGSTGHLIIASPNPAGIATLDATTGNADTETRPKNIAVLPLIVAK